MRDFELQHVCALGTEQGRVGVTAQMLRAYPGSSPPGSPWSLPAQDHGFHQHPGKLGVAQK